MEIIAIIVSIAGINYALLSWLRSDMKDYEYKMDTNLNSFKSEIRSWKEEINRESRDFHGRMCALEERHQKETNDYNDLF